MRERVMTRRTAWIAIVGLGVVCLGLVLSVGYPFSVAEPHAAKAPADRFTVGDADAFSASGRIVSDGETALAFEGVVTADGAWYERIVEPDVTTQKYYPGTGETVARHVHISDGARAREYREQVREDPDRVLVRADRDGANARFVVTRPTNDRSEPVSGSASVVVNSLLTLGYERTGTDASAVSTYAPRGGWYEGQRPYRVTGASGTVRANAETLAVRSVNASWALTVPAGSMAEYALVTLTTDAPMTREVTFEYVPGRTTIERPGWVPDGVRRDS